MVVTVHAGRSNLWAVYKQEVSKSKSTKLILNFASAFISFSSLTNKNTPSFLANFGKNMRQLNSFLGLFELPVKVEKFFKSIFSFEATRPVKHVADVSSNFCSVVSGGCSAVNFVDSISPLHKPLVNKAKILGAHTGLAVAVKALVDSVLKLKYQIYSYISIQNDALSNKISSTKFELLKVNNKFEFASNLLSIAAKTTLLALAIVAVVVLFVPVSASIVTTLSFSSSFLNLSSFFFDQVYISGEI